jgi:thiamine-phosphate pyrophosphorylase
MVTTYKDIAKIQFITHESDELTYENQIQLAINNHLPWVQFRAKNLSKTEVLNIAFKLSKTCKVNKIKLIINDYADIALEVDADGVHLGKEDISPSEARKLLGEEKIIGGTANTFEDIIKLYNQGVDYIGLGPLRFTPTKSKLSPILDFSGYKTILEKCKNQKIEIPIIAIGGIVAEDIPYLKESGVHGIATSSMILNAQNKEITIKNILEQLQS